MSGRLSAWAIAMLCALVGSFVFAGVASANTLPDGRIYEQVTPEEKYGSDVYQPRFTAITSELGGTKYSEEQKAIEAKSTIETDLAFQAAADGSGIVYVAGPTVGGNQEQGVGGGNEYLARRSSNGWTGSVLSPEGAPSTIFQAFSPDLSKAFVNSVEPLSSTAPGFGEQVDSRGNYDILYAVETAGREYSPLFSTRPPYRSMEDFGTVGGITVVNGGNNSGDRNGHSGYLAFEGASADDSHLLFAANDALTGASEGRPAAEGGSGTEFEKENNLYESVNGQLRLVNVLPTGTTHANAVFGGVEEFVNHEKRNILDRVISADGSRIFWTDLSTDHIYMREDGARTVEISPQGTYQTATSDGSVVFYTDGNLYAHDVENGQNTDITPGVTVEKVVGASENGEYVYYVTSTEELMLWHDGVSRPIADVSPALSEVTPDGHSIVFMVTEIPAAVGQTTAHVEVYDADTGALYCASCTSHGKLGMLPMTNGGNVYQPRWISADGSRVFFVTVEALVPQDTNEVQDVYEWERPGSGECVESTGCVYLLSGGTSPANAGFLDASENGNDVFIVTRASLVGSDEDDLFDVYDVGVRSPLVAPPACTGTGCQGVPNPQPIFATPSSVTFEGVGNFAAPGKETKAKLKPKKKPKHKKKGKKKSKAKKSARKADGRKRSSSKGGRS